MPPAKLNKYKFSHNDSASVRSLVAKQLSGASAALPRKVMKGKSSIVSRKISAVKPVTEPTSKHKTKDVLDAKSAKKDPDCKIDYVEMEITVKENESKKSGDNAKLTANSKHDYDRASPNPYSENLSPDYWSKTKKDVLMEEYGGDDHVSMDAKEGHGSNSGVRNSESDSELILETTDVDSSQEQEAEEKSTAEEEEEESTAEEEEEESMAEEEEEESMAEAAEEEESISEEEESMAEEEKESMAEEEEESMVEEEEEESTVKKEKKSRDKEIKSAADEKEGDAEEDEEIGVDDSGEVAVEDFVDDEAEEGSETDESDTQSEITLSTDEEERSQILFEGGSKVGPKTSTKKSDREYDEVSDDLDGFIVDDDFVECMSSDEAADLPDVRAEDETRSSTKRRRILKLPNSSDSEDEKVDFGPQPLRAEKAFKSKKKSQSSSKPTGEKIEPEQASESKQMYGSTLGLGSAKTKPEKSDAESLMKLSSKQEGSASMGQQAFMIPDARAQQFSKKSCSKMGSVKKSLKNARPNTPVTSRLSRLDKFRFSKSLSPARKRRESRDRSENWLVFDIQDVSSNNSSANFPQPKKKYAKLTTLAKKRVLKRSRCESESPLPSKKFKH
ncbi:hypothetical protein FHG87_004079 [Trinorchestia longiramus]|nr:hypothetical protein FHG87_004079 [Trinorchestia longiramus]